MVVIIPPRWVVVVVIPLLGRVGGGNYSPEGRVGGGGGNPPFGKDFTNFVEKDLYNSARRLQ